jgi:uncharacterized protein (DUF4415 family)
MIITPGANQARRTGKIKMNKEFAPSWDEPADASSGAMPAPKHGAGAPLKQIVTIRLDVEMLEWFKSGGPGYQTRINQVLREHMQAQSARPDSAG